VLLLAFAMRRLIDEDAYLVEIGIMSFIGAAQVAPAFFGGLYWRKASRAGVIAGMTIGFAIWFYALLLPSMANALHLNLEWLHPQSLFGWISSDPVTSTTVASLVLNSGAFVLVSLLKRTDLASALAFEHISTAAHTARSRAVTVGELADIAAQFVGVDHARTALREHLSNDIIDWEAAADESTFHFVELLIAGAIGAASARIVLAAALRSAHLSDPLARAALEEASGALREKHALMRAITENVQQGICAFDAGLNMLAWNNRFVQLLDLPPGKLRVGMPLAEIVALNRARGEYTAEQLELLIVNQDLATLSWPYVYERARPDGTVLEVTFNRMDIGGYVATYVDITERHRTSQALRAANELLEQRVQERTVALEQARLQAERANADKTRFLAAASHDLLQPLTAARLFMSAQQAHSSTSYTESALAALESTEGLLTELLYISLLDARAVTPAVEDVDLGALLKQLAAELTPLAQRRGIALRACPTTLAARTDLNLLRRALQNFLSNAIRYTQQGRVLIGCRRRGSRVRIEVWDTGIGIPDHQLQEIFLEFRRLPTEGIETEPGAGLGLAIVDRISRLIDARLVVRSRVGRGSMFGIEIARAASPVTAAAPEATVLSSPVDAARLLILCIDNDPRILEGMKALLERWGHRVVCAPDAAKAHRLLGDQTPDAALIDYHLQGGRNGLDLLQALRALWRRNVPVIIVTADRSEQVQSAALAAGCYVLHKPVKPAVLRRALSSAQQSRTITDESP
jgi:signal transduction histidine kinase/ActR/RegA family two-component response regulator